MSLSSFLLKSTQNVDSELDALFKSQVCNTPSKFSPGIDSIIKPSATISAPASTQISETPSKKRKLEDHKQATQVKRPKSNTPVAPGDKEDQTPKVRTSASKKLKARTKPKEPEEEEDDEDNSDIENAYLREKGGEKPDPKDKPIEEEESNDEDEEGDPSQLVHESLTGKGKSKSKRGSKQKYVPPDETPDQRDQRTIFIGNLSLEVAQKRVC